jgi:hypothetical protein
MNTQYLTHKSPVTNAHFALWPMKPSTEYLTAYLGHPNGLEGLHLGFKDWNRLADFVLEKNLARGLTIPAETPFDAYLELTGTARFAQHEQDSFYMLYSAYDPRCPGEMLQKLYLSESFCERVRQAMRTGRLRRYDRELASSMTQLTRLFKIGGGVIGVLHDE